MLQIGFSGFIVLSFKLSEFDSLNIGFQGLVGFGFRGYLGFM